MSKLTVRCLTDIFCGIQKGEIIQFTPTWIDVSGFGVQEPTAMVQVQGELFRWFFFSNLFEPIDANEVEGEILTDEEGFIPLTSRLDDLVILKEFLCI